MASALYPAQPKRVELAAAARTFDYILPGEIRARQAVVPDRPPAVQVAAFGAALADHEAAHVRSDKLCGRKKTIGGI
jgi:hypothetical protein